MTCVSEVSPVTSWNMISLPSHISLKENFTIGQVACDWVEPSSAIIVSFRSYKIEDLLLVRIAASAAGK
jgi:hypothetical protein